MSSPAIDHYLSQFGQPSDADTIAWLGLHKDSALEILKDQGMPTTRIEEWRYTDIAPILKRQFNFVTTQEHDITDSKINPARIADLDCYELVFLNGVYSPVHSNLTDLPGNIEIKSLKSAINDGDDWIKQYLNSLVDTRRNGFIALNTAFIQDGSAICIPDYVVLDKPINLIYLSDNTDDTSASNPRNLVVLGKQAEASVIETYFGSDKNEYFTNTITEIKLDEGSNLGHYRLQQEGMKAYHVGYMHVQQDSHSTFESHQISLGSKLARSDLDISLAGSGSECLLNGLFVAGKSQHMDHHTRVDHISANTRCSQTFRGILDGRARGVFNGKIIVHKDAQKTDAQLSNANLLLSNEAEIDTKPELEIYADDVKCSHGATVGRLDEQMLFYLRTRAIKDDIARSLLTFAFADDVVKRVRFAQIINRLENIIVGKLPDADIIKDFIK